MFAYDSAIALIGIAAGLLNLGAMLVVYRSRSNTYACLQQDLGKSIGVSRTYITLIEGGKRLPGKKNLLKAVWLGSPMSEPRQASLAACVFGP